MPFWMEHSLDKEHGGYFTCLDTKGNCYDETKYMWLNGRQVYMLSKLYLENELASEEVRLSWLKAAAIGASFLRKAITSEE